MILTKLYLHKILKNVKNKFTNSNLDFYINFEIFCKL